MKKIFSLLMLLASAAGFAQINFEPGYFKDNNGNTTQCLIKNVAWKNNPVTFEYKISESDAPLERTVSNTSEFSVNSYTYKRFTVKIDRSGNNVDDMSELQEPQWQTETLFLKTLVQGKATLYQYENYNLVKYFFSEGTNDTAEQLLYRQYKISGIIRENNTFRQQLYNLMKSEGYTTGKFGKVKYKKEELVSLFVAYNGNAGGELTNLSEKQNPGRLHLKITPGVTFSTLQLENGVSPSYNFDFDNETGFRLGAELEYILPFNNGKWALFIDPNYQQYKSSGKEAGYNWSAEYAFIELPIGARHYMFLNDKSKIFINAGYTLAVTIGDDQINLNSYQLEIGKSSTISAGAGFAYSSFSLEARYNIKHGLLNNNIWTAQYSSFNIILGYKIL